MLRTAEVFESQRCNKRQKMPVRFPPDGFFVFIQVFAYICIVMKNSDLYKKNNEIFAFLAKRKIESYLNMATIQFINDNDANELSRLLTERNYILRELENEKAKRLPVIITSKDGEHFGRFFLQYTNHNYVCGYKSLETNEIFPIDEDLHLSTSGGTIREALLYLWKLVESNIESLDVTYSEEEEDILNNIENG